jgi:hypothetical protein
MKLSNLEDDEFQRQVMERMRLDEQNLSDWRIQAQEAFSMKAGDQWDAEDKAKLMEEERPAVSFNRIESAIDVVVGLDINNRQDLLPIPRDSGSREINEVLAGALSYIRDECGAGAEESEVLSDCLTCGIGALSIWIDDLSEDDATVMIEHVDINEVSWDSDACRRNLYDARYVSRTKFLPAETIKVMWPETDGKIFTSDIGPFNDDVQIDDSLSVLFNDRNPNVIHHPAKRYSGLGTSHFNNPSSGIPVTEFYWREIENVYQISSDDQSVITLTEEQFNEYKEENDISNEIYRKTHKSFYWQAFLVNGQVVERKKSFLQTGFPILFATGKRDRVNRSWYGLTKNMTDPQRWANRFFSLIIDIIARNTKGGAFVEQDALLDVRKAEEDWSKTAPLIMLKRGGLRGIRDRQSVSYPAGIERMMQFAMESVRDISGINQEVLGMADRRQAGVVEVERKRSVLGILAKYFDNMRALRQKEGKALIELIPKYLPPDKLIRIDNENQYRFEAIQDLMDGDNSTKYDVIVDEAPSSASVRERAWFSIQQVLPLLLKSGIPIPPEIIDYMPIPKSLADTWKRVIAPVFEKYTAAIQAQGVPIPEQKLAGGGQNETMQGLGADAGQNNAPENEQDQMAYLQNLLQKSS